jgi:DNA-binding NarL/FixJ family response regulator
MPTAPQIIHQVQRGETYISEKVAEAVRDPLIGRPLSAEELTVLELMAQDIPQEEIAARLQVSPGNLLRDISRIYRKLDVPDDATALTKARELGLLRER